MLARASASSVPVCPAISGIATPAASTAVAVNVEVTLVGVPKPSLIDTSVTRISKVTVFGVVVELFNEIPSELIITVSVAGAPLISSVTTLLKVLLYVAT